MKPGKHLSFCTCGHVAQGNNAKETHELRSRAEGGHRWISKTRYSQLFRESKAAKS